MRVVVEWVTDGCTLEELGLPSEVDVPTDIEFDFICDWLSDTYGFLVETFVVL